MKRSDRGHSRYQCQQDQTDAIKMAWACVSDEGRQTDQKCTSVESNQEKKKRTTEQKMDGLYCSTVLKRIYDEQV